MTKQVGGQEPQKTLFPCIQDDGSISYNKGGRIICDVCKSTNGVRIFKYNRWQPKQVRRIFSRCVNCGTLEVRDNLHGGILKQEPAQNPTMAVNL
jgi:hypothetical protein